MTTYDQAETVDRWRRSVHPQRAHASRRQGIAPLQNGPGKVAPAREVDLPWSGGEGAGVPSAPDNGSRSLRPRSRRARIRWVVLVSTLGGAGFLVPWIAYLSLTLPGSQSGGAWRLAWVGFDIALAGALASTGWLAWNRRHATLTGLVVSATMLMTDAWFDVCLSWNTPGQGGALASAVLVEMPVALLLSRAALLLARRGAQTESRPNELSLTTVRT